MVSLKFIAIVSISSSVSREKDGAHAYRERREVVYCVCQIQGDRGRRNLAHALYPHAAKGVIEDATVQEWKTNAVESTREYQPTLYDRSFIKHMRRGRRGSCIDRTGSRPGPG